MFNNGLKKPIIKGNGASFSDVFDILIPKNKIEHSSDILFDNGPSIIEKIDMLFKDVETEGKKQGYERASKEYGKAFKSIEDEYKVTKELIEYQKGTYDNQSEKLIEKLEQLERQKTELERQVSSKANDVSRRYNIPVGDVKRSLASGTLIVGGPMSVDILGLIYKHKEKKLREAEQRGYSEAKELYETKIDSLNAELKRLKENGNKDIQKLLLMISEILVAISEEHMKIAELKILL